MTPADLPAPPGKLAGACGRLTGRRVLLVEDEMLVAMLIEAALQDEGCETIGPCGSLAAALTAARTEVMDAAVLDINLAGEMVFPAAELLAERRIPFLLLSGYGEIALPPDRRHWPIACKPFKAAELVSTLNRMIAAAAA